MYQIDINCDIGESFGAYVLRQDAEIMSYVSSVNIACGFHAGDFSTMNRTVELAIQHGVKIGAHPGLPDIQGFGRRTMQITPKEAYEITLYQVGALYAFVKAQGGTLNHVKPHGALYNMAATDYGLAEAIAEAIYSFDDQLILYGLSGSQLIHAGKKLGLQTANEVFADRTYQSDGTLTSRSRPDAVIENSRQALLQAIHMVKNQQVLSVDGVSVQVSADTLCLHGDSPHALHFVKEIYEAFKNENIVIQTINRKKSTL